jgi:peptidoglycan/LPS O-acetylase OafA/YrhL
MASAVETGNRTPRSDRARADRLAGLDLLRLLAALAVVLFHYAYTGPTRGSSSAAFPELAGIAKYGFLGVDLFFVISGLVIACSVDGRSWHAFARARFLRLYPGHLVCMTATALVLATLGSGLTPVTFAQWAANLTMVAPALGQPFMDGAGRS